MGDGGAMGEEFWMQWRAWALAMSWLGSRRGSALPSVSHDEHHHGDVESADCPCRRTAMVVITMCYKLLHSYGYNNSICCTALM
jgi:hypothetical protein